MAIHLVMCVWRFIVPLLLLADLVEAEPVTCFGLSDHGQASTVAFLTALGDVAMVDLGFQHGCALKSVGDVVCWGNNGDGQTTVPAGLTDVAGVVAGSYHSCIWTYAGTVQCWGSNSNGQLNVPSNVGHVLGVAAGWNSVCSWNTAGLVVCWGEDRMGELTVPAGLTDVQGAALGLGLHACAFDSANVGHCWGANFDGQTDVFHPNNHGYMQVSVGSAHSCGLRTNGKAKCWGASILQQLNIPGFFANGLNIDSGFTHNCGGRNGIMCWGEEYFGESVVPTQLVNGPAMWVTAFDQTTCAWERVTTTSTATTTTTATPGPATITETTTSLTETETTVSSTTTVTGTTVTNTVTTVSSTTTQTSTTVTATLTTVTATVTSTTTESSTTTVTDTTVTGTTVSSTTTVTDTTVTATTTLTGTTVSSTTTLTDTTVSSTTTVTSTTTATPTTVTATATTVTGTATTVTGTATTVTATVTTATVTTVTETVTTATLTTITGTVSSTLTTATVTTTTTETDTTVTGTTVSSTTTLTDTTVSSTTTATGTTVSTTTSLTDTTVTSTTSLTDTTVTVTGTTVTGTGTTVTGTVTTTVTTVSVTDTTVTDTETTQTYTGSSTLTTVTTVTATTETATTVTNTDTTVTDTVTTVTLTTTVTTVTATLTTVSSTTTATMTSTTSNTLSTITATTNTETTTATTVTATGTTITGTTITATGTTITATVTTITATVTTVTDTQTTVTETVTTETVTTETTTTKTATTTTVTGTTVTGTTVTGTTVTGTTVTGSTITGTTLTGTTTATGTTTTVTATTTSETETTRTNTGTATSTVTYTSTTTATTPTVTSTTSATDTSVTGTGTTTETDTVSSTTSITTRTATVTISSTSSTTSATTLTATFSTVTGTFTTSSTTATVSTVTNTFSTVTNTDTTNTISVTTSTTTTDDGDNTFFELVQSDVQEANQELVSQASTEPGRWVQQTPVGFAEAVSIKPENLTVDGSFVNIGNAALAPVELLRPFVEDGDDVVVVVTRVSNPSYLLQKITDEGEDIGEVHGMVEVTLYNRRTGKAIPVEGKLDQGILIKISDDAEPAGRMGGACVFVDDNTWSTEGMREASDTELTSSSRNAQYREAQLDLDDMKYVGHDERLTTDGLWCYTENFGINAFLLGQPLECASARMSQNEDLGGYEEDHHWITSRPALLYFALLLFLICCHVYTLHADRKYRMMDTWSDRRLDTLITQLTPEVHPNSNKIPEQPEKRIAPFYPYVTMALLIRCRLVTERHSVPLKGFPTEVLRSSFGPWGYNRRCWIFFRAFHPLVTLGDPPFMLSCVKNAKLMTDSILFPLCVLCLVYSAMGDLLASGSDPGCVPKSFAAGVAFVLAGFFAFLCGLPCRFQACCFARRDPEQQSSCRNDTCFWVLELLWTILHLVITLIYLSNVAPVDRWKWEVLLVLVLLFVFLLKPLIIALFLALWTGIVVRLWPELLQDPTPEPMNNANRTGNDELAGLDEVQRATVKNLAHRGISLAHMLDFYQKLGTVVMPQFDPQLATTEDVVRQAVVPLSRGDMNEVFGQPLKVKLGILRLLEHPGRVCDVFVRCEVLNRPMGVLETWAVPTVGLRQVDWCMEAELLGYQPGDSLELSLVEADSNKKLCSGRLRSRVLAGQHEVPLVSNSNLRLGTIILQITPPVNAAPPQVPRAPVAPPAYQSQGYLEWCGVADVNEHPAIPELCWVMPNCRRPDNRPRKVQLGDVEISIAQAAGRTNSEEDNNVLQRSRNVQGTSYASAVNVPILPGKMVTHNWSNSFTHLMAVVFADALGQETYGQLLPMLQARDTAKLRSLLGAAGKLDKSYWIDAFSVNQHMSICSNPLQLVDSMGMRIMACTCATPKITAGPVCENDKMPYMMAYLNALWIERGAEFEHVVAVDPAHAVFGRTWCIAELHEAYQANMHQTFILHSFDDLDAQATRSMVDGIDIRTSKTSYEEDKKHLVNDIDDVDAYNERVRNLVNYRLKNTNAVPAEKISFTTWLLDTLLI